MKICFILSCKLYQNYPNFLEKNIININNLYQNATIILIDNNSSFIEPYEISKKYDNIIKLENTSESKFELGAYNFATKYILDNNLKFNYYVFMQDMFLVNKMFDFKILQEKNIKCCPIYVFDYVHFVNMHINVLSMLGLYDPNEELLGCWCCSYITNHETLIKLYNITNNIHIKNRYQSMESERYLGKLLFLLNNKIFSNIDGNEKDLKYNIFEKYENIDFEKLKNMDYYFLKFSQQKNEYTA